MHVVDAMSLAPGPALERHGHRLVALAREASRSGQALVGAVHDRMVELRLDREIKSQRAQPQKPGPRTGGELQADAAGELRRGRERLEPLEQRDIRSAGARAGAASERLYLPRESLRSSLRHARHSSKAGLILAAALAACAPPALVRTGRRAPERRIRQVALAPVRDYRQAAGS